MAAALEIPRAEHLSIKVPIDRLIERGARQRRRAPQEEGEALVSVGVSPGASGSAGPAGGPTPETPSSAASNGTRRRMRVLPALGLKNKAEQVDYARHREVPTDGNPELMTMPALKDAAYTYDEV
eukprot:2387615-Pyramimonas_sp.AAC.1